MDIRAVGKRSVEWDLNDWKWDGDLFVARQLNHHGSSNSSSSCFDEGNVERRRKEMENKKKKTRAVPVIAMEEGNLRDDEDAPGLTLKLGGENADNAERNDARKTKFGGGIPNRAVCCQVENCVADLSKVKDYHRRHKVCEMHSKATSALVGGIMQRFCQQCSRFHVLEEFDEGKRSCRRRLAGHNKRRRKPNPDTIGNGNPLSDDQTSNYLLITLLKILSNIHSNQLDHSGDQDLLSHLLKSLVSQPGEQIGKNLVGLLQGGGGLQASQNIGNVLPFLSIKQAPREDVKQHSVNVPETPWQEVYANAAQETVAPYRSEKQVKMNDFDLNDIYIDLDGTTDVERSSPPPTNPATSSLHYHLDSRQSSPPQISNNSDSASDRSPSSSSGDAQGRTDRIVFKLFGKAPNDFPVALRGQILDWLTHSPTDIESYIRPGCIVLTIYVHQDEASWEELCCDLSFSLSRLLDLSDDPLWTDGWIYVRVQNQLAFAFNGQVVLDTYLPLRSHDYSQIITITPLAVSRKAQFTVKGINLRRPGTRLLCAVEGAYLVQEATPGMMEERDDLKEKNEIEFFTFSCEMPVASGRGFMEIEDQDGLSSSFFPFIVSEDEDVCSEIRRLESTLEFTGTDSAMQAMDFIHEIGWLLHRNELKPRTESDPNSKDLFPLVRLKFLIEFSMDREWCAVMKKLLNILFEEGTIDSSPDVALTELCLLHRAVRKNSKPMVEMLLRFIPKKKNQTLSEFFRPDAAGPAGLTPLHIAAGKDGSEDVLDALTEDPGMIGIQAWKLSRDNTGFTPEDYARLRGHFSYIHLVQRKVNGKPIHKEHVVVNIPESLHIDHKQEKKQCKLCDHKRTQHRSVAYRPAMLSMVAIAAVCVCVALLFKSCPEVIYVFQPFRWELLEYGTS